MRLNGPLSIPVDLEPARLELWSSPLGGRVGQVDL
jgi:hypothetical protein